jgi:hypothetical protein
MQNRDWVDLLKLFPAEQHNTLILRTQSGVELGIETLLRTEPTYIVFRGRLCGNTDEGRVFFLPYDQIVYLNVNRNVKEEEIRQLYDRPEGRNGVKSSESVPAKAGRDSVPDLPPVAAAAAAVGRGSSPNVMPSRFPPQPAAASIAGRVGPAPGSGMSPMSNVPAAALVPPPAVSGRMPNIPAAALAPPAPPGSGITPVTPAPRNSILERLRAQRNSMMGRPQGR